MDNIEFKVLLRHLGKDVIYMGQRVKTEVEKCVRDLDLSHDTPRFCQKLAGTLRTFSEFTQQYAKDLEERIKNAGREEDCRDAIVTIQQLSLKDVNCNSCKSRGQVNESRPNLEDGSNGAATDSDMKLEAMLALSQCSSLYISAEGDLKQEPLSQTNMRNADDQEASQNGLPQQQSISLEGSSDTVEYNITEGLASEAVAPEQSINCSTFDDDIFDRETVANLPLTARDIVTPHVDTAATFSAECGIENLSAAAGQEIYRSSIVDKSFYKQTDKSLASIIAEDIVTPDKSVVASSKAVLSTIEYKAGELITSAADQEINQSSIVDNIFDKETVVRSPSVAADHITSSTVPSEDEFNTPTSLSVEAMSAALSPKINVASSEPDTIKNYLTVEESDNSDIDILPGAPSKLTRVNVIECCKEKSPDGSIDERRPVSPNDSDTTVANCTPPRNRDDLSTMERSVSPNGSDTTVANCTPPRNLNDLSTMGRPVSPNDSDTTVANCTPPRNLNDLPTVGMPVSPNDSDVTVANFTVSRGRDDLPASQSDSDTTVANLTPPREPDKVSDLDKNVESHDVCSQVFTLETTDVDFEIQTQQDVDGSKDVSNVDKVDGNSDFSDVDFDAATQINSQPEDSDVAKLVTKKNNKSMQLSENSVESDHNNQQESVAKDAARVLKDIIEENNHDVEKLRFLKNLGMAPIEAQNKNSETCSHLHRSGGSGQNVLSDSGNSENEPLAASVEAAGLCLAKSAPNASYDSDVFGDVSGSETSVEALEGVRSIASRKLKYKQKKSLLKLISEFYLKRKREQEAAENSCCSSCEMKPVERKKSPRKKREDKKRSLDKRRSKKNLLFAEKGTDDSIVDIQEDSSNSAYDATTSKRKVSIEDHSENSGNLFAIEDDTDRRESSSSSLNKLAVGSNRERSGIKSQGENASLLVSLESDLEEGFRKKTVLPLRDTQSDAGELENSQPVNPFKRATVMPLPDSQTTVYDESQEMSPLMKKAVRPLPSSSSDEELSNQTLKRPHSPISGSQERNSVEGSKVVQPHKRIRVDGGLNPDDSQNHIPSEPSQFKLTDNDRDDLLEMLNEHTKDNLGHKEDVALQEPPGRLKLDDSDGDSLLNLFSAKEREQDARHEKTDQLRLDDTKRDELLSLLNDDINIDITQDSGDDDGGSKKPFKLGDKDRDQLLDLLCQHVKEGSGSNSEEESEEVNRETLLQLLNEYEEGCVQGKDLNASNNSLKELIGSKGFGATGTHEMDLCRWSSCSDDKEDSDVDSVVLDVLKEEAFEASETQRRRPGRPRDESKEAWAAYESLLQDDEDISDISSDTTDVERDDSEINFSDQERRQAKREEHARLRRQFGIHKELIVNVEKTDITDFDVSCVAPRQRKCSDSDSGLLELTKMQRLCDLSNVLQKRKLISPRLRIRHKKRRSSSISDSVRHSDSIDSDTDDSASSDQGSLSERTSPLCTLSDEEEQERLANALWEDIKNSSDELWSSHHDATDTSDDEEKEREQKKRKALSLGRLEASSSKKNSDVGNSSSTSESESNDSKGENKEENTDSKRADLDSSDEEDFVGVRKGQAAWRRDPLLNNSLSSNSDSNTDQRESRKKRIRKRRTRKPYRGSDGNFDSDETMANSDDAKKSAKKVLTLSDSDDSDFEIIPNHKTPQKVITIDDDEDTPGKTGKGRRNIRALVEDEDLAEATQRANNEEKERIRRLQERDRAKESLTQSFGGSQPSEEDCDPLILDLTEEIQIKVNPKISKKLKPHQRTGIQFMWDSCYESVKQLEDGWEGSGCILAHCMGLGKTLQALALIQTLFSHPVTKTKHVLVVCPLSTVSNWKAEYHLAYKNIKNSNVKLYTIQDKKAAGRRFDIVHKWWKNGGVLVLGYECFGMLIKDQKLNKWENQELCRKESILKALVDPGPDLVICDEGHLLRNKQSQRTLALNKVKTRRRIVLTGTPLQNNLLEYYYMVDFVKPNLLGTEKEFKTNFVNPISNGQFEDSTAEDIMFMKKRTHVLHKILNKTVQRVEDTELKQYLPKLVDQAVFVKLSDLQVNLYNTYLDMVNSRLLVFTKSGNISRKNFLADVQILRYICTHPNVITAAEKNSKAKIKEQDVIDDNLEDDVEEKMFSKAGWYKHLLSSAENKQSLELGTKMLLAIGIVEEAVIHGDKVLIFAQSYADMDTLESFLAQRLNYKKGRDYYRMDGTISPEVRSHMCDKFNREDNKSLRVFIMSTKVGGLGLNLTAANRVIILSVNWNPSYDTQSVFRSFRFGQTKAVFVYRLIALDTMEEKIYQRGVTKLAIAHRVVDKHQITRHYSAADIQEFYSARPSTEGERPVPNVPEDRVLAKLVQKHQFLYRWHEHQALLANRPEEDLDEHQKNAAWEEFNKKTVEPPLVAPQLPGAQPEVSGMPSNNNDNNMTNSPPNRGRRGAGRRRLRFRIPVQTALGLNRAVSGVDELNSIISESLSNSDDWINDGMNRSLAIIEIPERLEE